jgi:nucleoside-diphosphate-sugar epimerase
MTLLVTGGTGHLGRRFVPRLREAGHAPVLLGRSASCDFRADLADPATLEVHADAFAGVTTLVHGAHPMAGARPGAPEAAALVDASTTALAGLLGRLASLERVVHLSSTSAEAPADVYGVTKRLDEDLLRLHAEDRGIALCTLRISSVYGPEATKERALARFLRAALAGELPHVKGGEGPGVDYVHVDDVATAVVAATTSDATGVLHVTSNEAKNPLDAARLALRAVGREGEEPRRTPGPPAGGGGPIDNADARQALGWTPRYDLLEGLRSYAAWMTDAG